MIYLSDDMKAAASQSRLAAMVARAANPLTLKLYNGTQPSAGGAVTTQTMLVSVTLATPPGTVVAHTLTLNAANTLNQVSATGTPTWGRISDSNGNWLIDASAGVTGGGGVFTVDRVPIYQGGNLTALAMSLTEQ